MFHCESIAVGAAIRRRPVVEARVHRSIDAAAAIANDPTLLDWFEPLLTPVSKTLAGTSLSRLSSYDTGGRRPVQIAMGLTWFDGHRTSAPGWRRAVHWSTR
jgi:hypothetical protein